MDGQRKKLEEKLSELPRDAAEVSVASDYADETSPQVPHYTEIEERAHELGQRLSRQAQERGMAEILALDYSKGERQLLNVPPPSYWFGPDKM